VAESSPQVAARAACGGVISGTAEERRLGGRAERGFHGPVQAANSIH